MPIALASDSEPMVATAVAENGFAGMFMPLAYTGRVFYNIEK